MPRMSRFVSALICLGLAAVILPSTSDAYTVKAGDTPVSIAKKHGITTEELQKANKGLHSDKIHVGDTLTIPGKSSEKAGKKQTEKDSAKDKRKSESTSAKERAAESKDREKEHKGSQKKGGSSYTVKKGDTLGSIAAKHDVSVDEILKANKGLSASRLSVGHSITLPGEGTTAKAEPAEKSSRSSKAESSKAERSHESKDQTTYTAHRRDTPNSVARKFQISPKELANLNPDMGKKLHSGQKLVVPAKPGRSAAAEVEAPSRATEPETEEAMPERPTKAVKAAPETPVETAPVVPERPTKAAKAPEAAGTAPASVPDSRETAESESFFEKGIEFGKQNKFQKAVESFDKAIKLNPNRADFYASRGHANYYMKQYPKAIDDYTKAIEKNPNYALAYSMRGLSRTRSDHYPQALEDFNKAISFGPNEADYYKGRGFTYLHLKQYGPMCQDYQKACTLGDCELLDSAKKEKLCQ